MRDFLEKLSHFGQLIISLLVIFAFFGTIAALIWLALKGIDPPAGVKEVLLVLIGVLAGSYKDVIGFQIGSSLSSARKDATIAAQGKT